MAGFLAGALVAVLVAVFLAEVSAFGAASVLALGATLAPAAFAILARLALRRLAVFFLIRPFLAALSYSDCAFEAFAAVGFSLNALRAALIAFLISTL